MSARESTEEEMRQDGIEYPKGIYCKRCGYYYDDWQDFFQHHKAKHPWMDPDMLKEAREDAKNYLRQFKHLAPYLEP